MLDKYIRQWNLSNPNKIATTFTSEVYKVDSEFGPSVLKLLNYVGVKDEGAEALFLKNCDGHGAAKIYKFDEFAHLIEYLPGANLYEYSKIKQEEKATSVFIKIIRKIHSAPIPKDKGPFFTIPRLLKIFNRIEIPENLKDVFRKAYTIAQYLQDTQTQEVLLHGDLHHENVKKSSLGDYVCFDPKGIIGDPCYELGTALKNPKDYPEIANNLDSFKERAQTFSKELNLPLERIVGYTLVYLCLSIAWSIEDGMEFSQQINLQNKVLVYFEDLSSVGGGKYGSD